MSFDGQGQAPQTIWNNGKLMMAYLALLAVVALAGLAAFYVSIMLFPPLQVLDAGVHETGHAIAVVLTGGKVDAIYINMAIRNSVLTFGNAAVNQHGGNYLAVGPAGVLFSILVSALIARAPLIRWYAPALCMGNLLQLSPMPFTDGGGILMAFGPFGVIVYATVLMLSLALCFYAIHCFVEGNLITRLVRERTGLISRWKHEIIIDNEW